MTLVNWIAPEVYAAAWAEGRDRDELPGPEISKLLDALVLAVAEDPAIGKSEWTTATDVVAGIHRRNGGTYDERRLAELMGALEDLDRADADEYEEWALLPGEHDDPQPTLPESRAHRMERLQDGYTAPADLAACAVLIHYLNMVEANRPERHEGSYESHRQPCPPTRLLPE